MLSSRYAPVVALTIVGILVVGALGWFLAVSPKLDEASETRSRAAAIDDNTAQVMLMSARLNQYSEELEAVPDYSEVVALNAPSIYSAPVVRERIADAVESSGVAIFGATSGTPSAVPGIEADPGELISNQIASLFALGPVDPALDAEEFSPVLEPVDEPGPVVQRLYGVPLELRVTGSPAETMSFIEDLTDPEAPVLQFSQVNFEARQADSAQIAGVPDADNGDVIATVTGYVYLLNPSTEIIDEESLAEVQLPGRSPFEEIAGSGGGSDD